MASGDSAPISSVGNTLELESRYALYGVDLGYDATLGPITLRPGLGMGTAVLSRAWDSPSSREDLRHVTGNGCRLGVHRVDRRLVGLCRRGGAYGMVGDVVVGIVGAFVGGSIFRALGIDSPFSGIMGSIFVSFIGATILLIVIRALHRTSRSG